jgi:rhamnulose-1-phosphate aldolase/alcohol dehydrogenase
MSIATRIVEPVEDRWPGDGLGPSDVLEELVFVSHLLGSDRAVANYGGGNTSAKGTMIDHVRRDVATMWVKGSGSDLGTMAASGFTALRLEEILPLFDRDEMSDGEMVDYLARCQLDPAAPRPSIETLLHAFIPAPHVHHTHPDATNVLACARGGRELIDECFGPSAAWIEYTRPGFTLAREVGMAVRADPDLGLVVLAKHGLITWGATARQAYERTISACNQAADFVNRRGRGSTRFGGRSARPRNLDLDARRACLHAVLPALRGAVSSGRSKLLVTDLSPAVVELVDSRDGERVTTVGAACPDHLIHTKRVPLWVPYDPASDGLDDLVERITARAATFRAEYAAYFERNAHSGEECGDPDPRVVLIENLGLVATGPTLNAALISRDLYFRAIEVMSGAGALSEFVSLTEAESFAVEYWPMELYKLSLTPPAGELQGKVALVTGAAGGIGRAVVEALSGAGAYVVAFDIDGQGAVDAVQGLGPAGTPVAGDVTSEAAVAHAFASAIDTYGGVDIVVSNAGIASSASVEDTTVAEWQRNQSILGTGYFLIAREAFRVMRRQGTGGAVVFVGSKNALLAGKNSAAYSSAKAAELQLARSLAEEGGSAGIRVNTVNPDAVLQGSRIWDSEWRAARAAAYGISAEELPEHYRSRTVLGVDILPEDVAQAVLHFASATRSGKTTGNLLNVDGGVAGAYPR